MTLQVDFDYPRQVSDMTSLKTALKTFDRCMNTMMLLMKDLGNALEGVSHAFDELTSLSFSDGAVKESVHCFAEQIIRMKEGTPFQEYNTRVHDDVVAPVRELKAALAQAERAAGLREVYYKQYLETKRRVDAKEKSYAAHNRSLETSSSYAKLKQQREDRLHEFQTQDATFQHAFGDLVTSTDAVTSHTMQRYLELNAAYMTAVIEALVHSSSAIRDGATPRGKHDTPPSSNTSTRATQVLS